MQQYGNHIFSDHNGTSPGGLLAGGADTCNPGCAAEDPEEKEVMTNVFDRTDPGYTVDRVTMWSMLRGIYGSPFIKSPWHTCCSPFLCTGGVWIDTADCGAMDSV